MWRNAAVTFRAGVLVGPADMLSRLTECRSAAEMATLIPDSHKPISADRGDTAHLETGESGPTDSIRAVGLPMQRLAMLRPPTTQQFKLAQHNYDECTDTEKDLGLCAPDPLRYANNKNKHDFDGLPEWFLSGRATTESCKQSITDDIPLVASLNASVADHVGDPVIPGPHIKSDVDPKDTIDANDVPTATGSTEWHKPHGNSHARWTKFVRDFAMKHPFQDRDLKQSEIYLAKFVDTRPIDADYMDYCSGDAEVKLRGDGRLREMIIAWTEYETIDVAEIIRHGNPNYVMEQEEIVCSAHVRDDDLYNDLNTPYDKFNSARDQIQTDEDYDSNDDDDMAEAMQGYVNHVIDKLGGPVVATNEDT